MSSFASGYCTNPADAGLIGKTITGYSWYPGTIVTNTQQIWTGQFRTSMLGTTRCWCVRTWVRFKPESYDGTQEGGFRRSSARRAPRRCSRPASRSRPVLPTHREPAHRRQFLGAELLPHRNDL